MVLQQAHSTQEVLEQHYLAVEQATPMTQFATSQEYMYGDEAPLDMHGVELPEGYRHDHPGGEGGVCSDSECLRQHPGTQCVCLADLKVCILLFDVQLHRKVALHDATSPQHSRQP